MYSWEIAILGLITQQASPLNSYQIWFRNIYIHVYWELPIRLVRSTTDIAIDSYQNLVQKTYTYMYIENYHMD